jgi:cellobiose-specific phosphotransferase system component IIB
MNVELTGNWYSDESSVMTLWITVELQLVNGTKVTLAPESWEQTTFEVDIPLLSSITDSGMSVSVLITATSVYDNHSTLIKVITVNNTVEDSYRSTMHPVEFDHQDNTDIYLLSSQIKLTLQPPINGLRSNEMCHRNSDCSNQGV